MRLHWSIHESTKAARKVDKLWIKLECKQFVSSLEKRQPKAPWNLIYFWSARDKLLASCVCLNLIANATKQIANMTSTWSANSKEVETDFSKAVFLCKASFLMQTTKAFVAISSGNAEQRLEAKGSSTLTNGFPWTNKSFICYWMHNLRQCFHDVPHCGMNLRLRQLSMHRSETWTTIRQRRLTKQRKCFEAALWHSSLSYPHFVDPWFSFRNRSKSEHKRSHNVKKIFHFINVWMAMNNLFWNQNISWFDCSRHMNSWKTVHS